MRCDAAHGIDMDALEREGEKHAMESKQLEGQDFSEELANYAKKSSVVISLWTFPA